MTEEGGRMFQLRKPDVKGFVHRHVMTVGIAGIIIMIIGAILLITSNVIADGPPKPILKWTGVSTLIAGFFTFFTALFNIM